MKPIFKYSGGKSREAKFITSLINKNKYSRIVEPFCGGAAISFYLEMPALVTDIRKDILITFNVVKDKEGYEILQNRCNELSKELDIKKLEEVFYYQRDKMWCKGDELDVAWRFIVIRQLVFSGIDRINQKTGKENAPFGWYKQFKCNLSKKHHTLLQTWEIKQQPLYETLIKETLFFVILLI